MPHQMKLALRSERGYRRLVSFQRQKSIWSNREAPPLEIGRNTALNGRVLRARPTLLQFLSALRTHG